MPRFLRPRYGKQLEQRTKFVLSVLKYMRLKSRLREERGASGEVKEALVRAQRDARDARQKAAAANERITVALRSLRRQIMELKAADAPSAQTADISECGNKAAGGSWTGSDVSGAGDFNLTARNLSCVEARAIVDHMKFESDPPYAPYYPGWSCGYLTQAYEFNDIRCTSGSKAIRWQSGA